MSSTISSEYVKIEVDVGKINSLLSHLNDREAKAAIRSALRKSILIIRKEAQKNLVSIYPSASKPSTKKGISYKAIKNDINIAVYKNVSGARIDLLDKRKKGARSYILRFAELGTKERATKKGANRGIMNSSGFFNSAVLSKKDEANKSLEQNIINSINKVIEKHK